MHTELEHDSIYYSWGDGLQVRVVLRESFSDVWCIYTIGEPECQGQLDCRGTEQECLDYLNCAEGTRMHGSHEIECLGRGIQAHVQARMMLLADKEGNDKAMHLLVSGGIFNAFTGDPAITSFTASSLLNFLRGLTIGIEKELKDAGKNRDNALTLFKMDSRELCLSLEHLVMGLDKGDQIFNIMGLNKDYAGACDREVKHG